MSGFKRPVCSSFDPETGVASVVFNKKTALLKAKIVQTSGPLVELNITGFAAEYKTGNKLWEATATFIATEDGRWSYAEVNTPDYRFNTSTPPKIIGFWSDVPESQRGMLGIERSWQR